MISSTLDNSWLSCVTEACDKTYMTQNIYQGTYIAEVSFVISIRTSPADKLDVLQYRIDLRM